MNDMNDWECPEIRHQSMYQTSLFSRTSEKIPANRAVFLSLLYTRFRQSDVVWLLGQPYKATVDDRLTPNATDPLNKHRMLNYFQITMDYLALRCLAFGFVFATVMAGPIDNNVSKYQVSL